MQTLKTNWFAATFQSCNFKSSFIPQGRLFLL